MTAVLAYQLAGAIMFVLALISFGRERRVVKQVLALNIMGTSVFMILVAGAAASTPPDPVPHALVLTGLVVSVAATALLLLIRRRGLQLQGEEPGDH